MTVSMLECLNDGVQDFLSKPIDSAALWATISRHFKLAQV